MNLGAIMIFARRAAQISAYIMLALNTIKIAGFNLGIWTWIIAGMMMTCWIALDVRVVFKQEQDFNVRNSKTLMDGLNRFRKTQDD